MSHSVSVPVHVVLPSLFLGENRVARSQSVLALWKSDPVTSGIFYEGEFSNAGDGAPFILSDPLRQRQYRRIKAGREWVLC